MARIRTIKPEFWSDDKILQISRDARLFFIALWNFADDNGVVEFKPLQLKAQIFPLDMDIDANRIVGLANELVGVGLVVTYEHNGTQYLWIRNFKKHQHIDRPRKSNLPLPHIPQDTPQTSSDFTDFHMKSHEITGFHVKSDEIIPGKEKEKEKEKKGKGREYILPSSLPSVGKKVVGDDADLTESPPDQTRQNDQNNVPYQSIIDTYHEVLPELPRCKGGKEVRKHIRARWKENREHQDVAWWRKYFLRVRDQPFLMGKNDRGWVANLLWLVRPGNMEKVMDGIYRSRSPTLSDPAEKGNGNGPHCEGLGLVSPTTAQNVEVARAWLERKKREMGVVE